MIPVIFIHHGRPFEGMKYVLAEARKRNEVYLISDAAHPVERTSDLNNYHAGYTEFQKVFENLSSNPEWFESAAFSRWFILSEFMRKENVPLAFHLDTDVLLYADATQEYDAFRDYDLTLVVGNCGAATFITAARAADFCEYVMKVYTDKDETFQSMRTIVESMHAQGLDGGVSDMLLLEFYRKQNGIPYAEMTDIRNGSAYDHVLRESMPGGYRMRDTVRGPIKDIEFENGLPFATVAETGQRVQMKSLHFQGDSELFISQFGECVNGRPHLG